MSRKRLIIPVSITLQRCQNPENTSIQLRVGEQLELTSTPAGQSRLLDLMVPTKTLKGIKEIRVYGEETL